MKGTRKCAFIKGFDKEFETRENRFDSGKENRERARVLYWVSVPGVSYTLR
jgi:hypothetical protein